MTIVEHLVQTPFTNALGWTLLHSLWEGTIVAMVLGAALLTIRSSRLRYASACLAMLGVLAGFAFTFFLLLPGKIETSKTIAHSVLRTPLVEYPNSPGITPATFRAAEILPWLVLFWMAGVILFHLRNLAGWMAARRLSHRGVCHAPDRWQQRLIELRVKLRLSRPVSLFETALADVPVVIGYLSPVILVPIGLLAGMPVRQVEAILLHELAHIRRRDYLVNLLQMVVEGFLFYHPAIWWISGVIRAERENCCDDLVVAISGDAHEYAFALAVLEQTRGVSHQAALAATGGSLVKRIGRLLDPPKGSSSALAPFLSAVIVLIAGAGALAAWEANTAWSAKPIGKPQVNLVPQSPPRRVPEAPALGPVRFLAQAPQAPVPPPKVSPYTKWLNEEVVYIISDEERIAFQSLRTEEERDHFIEQFWARRDPTPDTPENEFREEHYRRIAYANDRFAARSGKAGWRTDRGRIYIELGSPDEIESFPSGRAAAGVGGNSRGFPSENWRYRYLEGIGNDVDVEFVDKDKNGEFPLTADVNEKKMLR